MTENELAIENGLRAEVTEAFMGGLKKLFIKSNINLPDESLDAVAEMSEKLDEMETRNSTNRLRRTLDCMRR